MRSRIRPVIMTAAMAAIGLMPAAMSHGIGSESQRPLAIVIIGGLIGATFFALFIFPLIVEMVYKKMLYDKEGKSSSDVSEQCRLWTFGRCGRMSG